MIRRSFIGDLIYVQHFCNPKNLITALKGQTTWGNLIHVHIVDFHELFYSMFKNVKFVIYAQVTVSTNRWVH